MRPPLLRLLIEATATRAVANPPGYPPSCPSTGLDWLNEPMHMHHHVSLNPLRAISKTHRCSQHNSSSCTKA